MAWTARRPWGCPGPHACRDGSARCPAPRPPPSHRRRTARRSRPCGRTAGRPAGTPWPRGTGPSHGVVSAAGCERGHGCARLGQVTRSSNRCFRCSSRRMRQPPYFSVSLNGRAIAYGAPSPSKGKGRDGGARRTYAEGLGSRQRSLSFTRGAHTPPRPFPFEGEEEDPRPYATAVLRGGWETVSDGRSSHLPDVAGILADRPVGGEPAHARRVADRLRPPGARDRARPPPPRAGRGRSCRNRRRA